MINIEWIRLWFKNGWWSAKKGYINASIVESFLKCPKSNIQYYDAKLAYSLTALKIKHIKTVYTTKLRKYLSHCEFFHIIRHLQVFDKFTTKVKTSQKCNNSGWCILIILNSLLTLKKPVVVIMNSTYLILLFKMLVKQRKINVKMFPSKELLKVKHFPRVFGTNSLVATVFDNVLI